MCAKKKTKITIKDQWNEKWLPMPFKSETKEKNYYFSNYGRLKSIDKSTENEKLLKGSTSVQNYKTLNIRLKDNSRPNIPIHRTVAKAFLPPPREDQVFLVHIDGDLHNNFFQNLRWVNQEELTAFRMGKGSYGYSKQRTKTAVLSIKKVKEIKQALRDGSMTQVAMARKYKVSTVSIQKIKKGIIWAHVTIDD